MSKPNNFVQILRWIGFLPGSLLAGLAAGAVVAVVVGVGVWLTGGSFISPWSRLLSAGWSGYAAVRAGAWVAPCSEKTVPAVLSAVVMFLIAGGAIRIYVSHEEWFSVVAALVLIGGAAIAMAQFIQADKDLRRAQSNYGKNYSGSAGHAQ
jgi:hypothetical protein